MAQFSHLFTTWLLLALVVCCSFVTALIGLDQLLPENWRSSWERTYYRQGEPVNLLVNRVESDKTRLPYAYYNLPFVCPPRSDTRPVQLSLGEILDGDRLWMSDYQLKFGVDQPCMRLCDRITKPQAVKKAADLIRKDYTVSWWLDGLPGSTTLIRERTRTQPAKKYYVPGFAMGFVQDNVCYIHNHVMLVIRWHAERHDGSKNVIVGFEVYPKSVSDSHCPGASPDYTNLALDENSKEPLVIPFTYSVYWREDSFLDYDHRNDLYIDPSSNGNEGRMHWFAIINSLVLVSLLSIFAAVVLVKALHSDFQNDQQGWRTMGDQAFFEPSHVDALCVLAGTGVQLFFTIAGVFLLLSAQAAPPTQSLISASMTLFVFAGFFAGFSSVQFYKRFSVRYSWKHSMWIAFMSSSALSGLYFVILFICNTLTYENRSSRAIQLNVILALAGVYVLLQVPICLAGGFISNKVDILDFIMPGRILPRTEAPPVSRMSVSHLPKYLQWKFLLPACGVFPFGILFIEMMYTYKYLWGGKSGISAPSGNSIYGFLALTTILLTIVVSEISVITSYLRMNVNDWSNWQWKSFLTCSGSVFCYLLLYMIYYLSRMKIIDAVSPLLYLTYSMMLNVIISLACGSLGLLASMLFLYTIYTSVKKE